MSGLVRLMCRRTSTDPLLQALWRDYGLNLLQVPREHAAIGDLYAVRDDRPLPPGRIADVLTPSPRLPPVQRERLADLATVTSDGVSAGVGLGLLEGFLTALGAGPLVGRVRARYDMASARRLRFRLEDCTRESVPTTSLGQALIGCSLRTGHPMAGRDYRHFVTVGVVRTSSITIVAEASSQHRGNLDSSVPLLADARAAIAIERAGEGALCYRGPRPLAIGVELVELDCDTDSGRVGFRPPLGPLRIRGVGDRAFVGPDDGDAFLPV
jgi:hypothetical protein